MSSPIASSGPSEWRKFRIARIAEESAVIKSFYLEAADGAPVAPHKAGQHLPIRLEQRGDEPALLRTYTISVAPSAPQLRISVRKLGAGSGQLHDDVAEGDLIECRVPGGDFVIDTAPAHPAVMVAAGVGITPILAMLSHLVEESERTGAMRPVIVFYAARNTSERGFDDELSRLAERSKGRLTLVRLLKDIGDAVPGRDYEEHGVLSAEMFRKYLGFQRHDFYLCGPPGYMQSVYDILIDHGVADHAIFAEAFGAMSLKRQVANSVAEPLALPATEPVDVVFDAAGTRSTWAPGAGSLLELAEGAGLSPEFGCREGACGACKVPLLSGAVAYFRETSAACGPNEVLICSAVPAAGAEGSVHQVVLALR